MSFSQFSREEAKDQDHTSITESQTPHSSDRTLKVPRTHTFPQSLRLSLFCHVNNLMTLMEQLRHRREPLAGRRASLPLFFSTWRASGTKPHSGRAANTCDASSASQVPSSGRAASPDPPPTLPATFAPLSARRSL